MRLEDVRSQPPILADTGIAGQVLEVPGGMRQSSPEAPKYPNMEYLGFLL